MATFPSYIKILADGFQEEPESTVRRTEMESGPAKQVPMASLGMVKRPINGQIESRANYLAFKVWFKSDGAGWFDWRDPVDNTVKQARIVEGKYTATPLAALEYWRISMTLETWG